MLSQGNDECNPYNEWYPLNTHFGQYGHTNLAFCFVFLYFEKTGLVGRCDPNPNDTYNLPCSCPARKCPIIRSIPIPLSKAFKHVVFAAHAFARAK